MVRASLFVSVLLAGPPIGAALVIERDAVLPVNVSDMFCPGLLCDEVSNVVAHGFGRVVFWMAEVEFPYGLSVDFHDVPAAASIATVAGMENKNARHAQILARHSGFRDAVSSLGRVGNPFEVPVGMRGERQMAGFLPAPHGACLLSGEGRSVWRSFTTSIQSPIHGRPAIATLPRVSIHAASAADESSTQEEG